MRAEGEDHDSLRIPERRHDVVTKPFPEHLDALVVVGVVLLRFVFADAPDSR